MSHCVVEAGISRSFSKSHSLLHASKADGAVLVIVGVDAGKHFAKLTDKARFTMILVELGTECLGEHTGESRGEEGGNVLGFARYRLGDAAPSDLVEIVRQPGSSESSIQEAKTLFEEHGLKTAVCKDFPGRIVDRLVRPYFNAALGRLDAELASAGDMDLTLRLGLGYPSGPIELLEKTGLAAHYDVTQALFQALGSSAYAPARRAQVAKARQSKGQA